jgi:hypothetical protein
MKLKFNSKKYFPYYFMADIALYAMIVWAVVEML